MLLHGYWLLHVNVSEEAVNWWSGFKIEKKVNHSSLINWAHRKQRTFTCSSLSSDCKFFLSCSVSQSRFLPAVYHQFSWFYQVSTVGLPMGRVLGQRQSALNSPDLNGSSLLQSSSQLGENERKNRLVLLADTYYPLYVDEIICENISVRTMYIEVIALVALLW